MSSWALGGKLGEEAVWHDVECGAYAADLPLWKELAGSAAGPVLELGCGTGRVALTLARAGFTVAGVESSPALAAELRERARRERLELEVLEADARAFSCERRFALICAPMQFVHLLGGRRGREAMLERSRAHLLDGGTIALALLASLSEPPAAAPPPLPDVGERDGWVYSSQPLDARLVGEAIEVRRLRQLVSPAGELREQEDSIRLDDLDPETILGEATGLGLGLRERIEIEPTHDHVGSTVVVLEQS